MATRRCHICHKPAQIDDLDLSCPTCEEKELDVLMGVYEYIHDQGAGYIPETDLLKSVEPRSGIKLNPSFIKNWIQKGWLEQNEMQSVKVPESIEDEIEKNGYDPHAAAIRDALNERKAGGRRSERKMTIDRGTQQAQGRTHRMVVAERRQFD